MASDDCHERVKGALAVALPVFLAYKKRRRVSTLAERALVLDVLLKRGHTIHGDDESASIAMVPASNALGKSTHDQIVPRHRGLKCAVVYNAQESRAETPRLQREARNFRRRFRILYELFLELVKLAKQVVFVGSTDVAGRQGGRAYLWS